MTTKKASRQRDAFSLPHRKSISSSLFLPSLMAGAGQQFLMLMLSHLFLPLLDHTTHCITSILCWFPYLLLH
jgi:hypothetical protein